VYKAYAEYGDIREERSRPLQKEGGRFIKIGISAWSLKEIFGFRRAWLI